ncbi:MAG TPA: NAD(P)/FAD-dependent oxidoreductase [Rhodobacteraceae bacterium]|nr:NAD(P)/FAD-dependent oxidoreductase [Paracoccaceae bacterium]
MHQDIETYDIIAIGAGLGALTAAAIQARRGKRVLVIEKHKVLGGYASVFARKGTRFDVSLHQIGGIEKTRVKGILEQAGVYDKIDFVKLPVLSHLDLAPDTPPLAVPAGDMDGFRDQLLDMFPTEKRAIRLWFWTMRRFGRQIAFFDKLRVAGPLRQGFGLFPFPLMAPVLMLASIWPLPLSMVLRSRNPELRKILLHFSGYYGLPAERINMLFPMAANYSYYADGGYYPKGGGYAISRNLSMVIRKNGGKIITGQGDSRILTRGDQITGVQLGDQKFHCEEIICGANPFTVYRDMLPDHPRAKSELERIGKLETGMTACSLYIRLDTPIENLNPDLEGHYEYVRPPEGSEAQHYERFQSRSGFDDDYSKDGLTLTIHSTVDPQEGTGSILNLFYADNYARWASLGDNAYQAQKRIEIDKMLNELEKLLPDVRNHIDIIELGTPLTMQKFTGNEGGAIYGFAQSLAQSGRKRFKINSPLRGLKFVSAWSNPGGGYEGVLRVADSYANPISRMAYVVLALLIAAAILIGKLM